MLSKPFFGYIHFFSKQITASDPYKFHVKMLVSSDNVVCIHNNNTVLAWIPRCKGVEILNMTLTRILCGPKVRSYINIV